jgi:hypothetical protein
MGPLADFEQTKNSPSRLAKGVGGQDVRRNLPMLLEPKGLGAYETTGAASKKL